MAIRSSQIAYVINEEEDGFVAVDFDLISDEDQQDLSSWEIIDQSDDDDDIDLDEDEKDEENRSDPEEIGSDLEENGSAPSDLAELVVDKAYDDDKMMIESPPSDISHLLDDIRYVAENSQSTRIVKYDLYDKYDDDEEEEDEEEEEDDYDVDDELIPYYVNDKFGRQRMRKLGKRSCPKMMKTRRASNYSRPGSVRGKHGLGLKHSLI